MKTNKILPRIIFTSILLILIAPYDNITFASSNTVYINSSQDFIDFTKDASLDTYFNNKTVILTCDIDLSDEKNIQVPTFNGTFNGQGYTISGVMIDKNGSNQGLFRYLQEDGYIKNLTVSGKVEPGGSQSNVGGIVGENKGNIEYCVFEGELSGKSNIGGISGTNEASGVISNCESRATIMGDHFTGGIVGQNLGTIFKSTNYSKVNTTISESNVEVESVDWSKINSTENISAHTDTGGVAGYSSGYIQDCINRGHIGYKYMGYNVGGIVGRQSGHLSMCKNYNTVLGRKDVGGIVGQIEPHLILLFSEDTLQELNTELDVLQNLFSNTYQNINLNSQNISDDITNIGRSLDNTRDIVQVISKESVNYIDNVTDTVNITGERIRYTMEEILPILDNTETVIASLEKGLNDIELGFNNLETTSSHMAKALYESQKAMRNLNHAISYSEDSIQDIEKALNDLLEIVNKKEEMNEEVINELDNALKNLGKSLEDASNSISNIYEILKDIDDIDEEYANIYPEILAELEEMYLSLKDISKIPEKLGSNIRHIINTGVSQISKDIQNNLDNISSSLRESMKRLRRSTNNLEDTFKKLEDGANQSEIAFYHFAKGFSNFKDGFNTMEAITVSVNDLIDALVSRPNIQLPNVSSRYRQSGEDLFDNMERMSIQVRDMNNSISNTKSNLFNDIEGINNQIINIFNLLIKSRQGGKTEYIEDITDTDVSDSKQGVTYKNWNYGSVEGSTNIGGISGIMAVEYDLDPEDDVLKEGVSSFNFKYLTTAIMKECANYGKVTAKKDCSGGVVGRMNLGIVTECENYGDIISKSGDYVGGIAGISNSSIDKSFVMSSLSGVNYIGGIGGSVNNLTNSYAMIEVKDGSEYIGSIAGAAEGELYNNFYVHETISAVDGISYSNKASPISYNELLKVNTLPDEFTEFYITFIADGNIVDRLPFEYGDSIDEDMLPKVPKKFGYDGQWEDFTSQNMVFNTTVEAIYRPIKTVISSKNLSGKDKLPLFLAEGKFNKDTKLIVEPQEITTDDFKISNHRILEAWKIDINNLNDSNEDIKIRYYFPHKTSGLTIWQDTGNEWEKVDFSINGSYLVFKLEKDLPVFCLSKRSFPWPILLIIIVTIVIVFINRKKAHFRLDSNNMNM